MNPDQGAFGLRPKPRYPVRINLRHTDHIEKITATKTCSVFGYPCPGYAVLGSVLGLPLRNFPLPIFAT